LPDLVERGRWQLMSAEEIEGAVVERKVTVDHLLDVSHQRAIGADVGEQFGDQPRPAAIQNPDASAEPKVRSDLSGAAMGLGVAAAGVISGTVVQQTMNTIPREGAFPRGALSHVRGHDASRAGTAGFDQALNAGANRVHGDPSSSTIFVTHELALVDEFVEARDPATEELASLLWVDHKGAVRWRNRCCGGKKGRL
jgi:hypothetical protein